MLTTFAATTIFSRAKNSNVSSARAVRILVALLLLCGPVSNAFAQIPDTSTRKEQQLTGPRVPDNRMLVANPKMFPFSAVVKLIVTFPNGKTGEGTGALIGPDKVLTADHVVFNESFGGHATEVEVLPGYSDDYQSCGRTYMASLKHGAHNGCHAGADCDVAIITTRDRMGCNTGWFGFKQFDHDSIGDVFIAGYPGDLNGGERMYFVRTQASHAHGHWFHNTLMYTEWTYEGMSGGPIFTSDYNIVGIHTEGGSRANYGIALCNQLVGTLRGWLSQ
jgi:V8-like Glu-specific endopeptidase